MDFNKIVDKMLKKRWKVFFNEDISELFFPGEREENYDKISKLVYKLNSEGVIKKIKNWVYIIPDKDDSKLNEVDLIDKYTLKLIKKYISYNVRNEYFITWKKSLELHMKNYYFWDKIFVINRNLNKKIIIWDTQIIFKTVKWKDENLYSKLSKFTTTHDIEWLKFKSSCLELSLLESALTGDSLENLDIIFIQKVLKKYKKVLNFENFEKLAKMRYITPINRLKEISKLVDDDLYKFFLELIKKNWNIFLWEKIRGF